jgi:hypothetical protein
MNRRHNVNVVVLWFAQFSSWVGVKVRPNVMGCNVAFELRTLSSLHRTNPDMQNRALIVPWVRALHESLKP